MCLTHRGEETRMKVLMRVAVAVATIPLPLDVLGLAAGVQGSSPWAVFVVL